MGEEAGVKRAYERTKGRAQGIPVVGSQRSEVSEMQVIGKVGKIEVDDHTIFI